MIRILLLILFTTSLSLAQTYTSTIRGTVKDADSGLPLGQATVQLGATNQGTTTDENGIFRFEKIPFGRYTLAVSFLGYETVTVPEILLESGKENIQQIKLTPTGRQLKEATVTSARPVAFNSVQAITIEQTLRYAATYMDPARVATSFPGVAAANDQANGLVIRGNSPNGMQWRLEGLEIVNPNHLSNAGTYSDRPTQTGGGVNILSTQLLGTSYFLTGAFPAQYGNVLAGVMDMNLRKGNDEKTEFTAQASLLGLDFAAEGPFSKKSKASYVVNYRYSFTGLLGAMGISFGGEDIRFQDFSFNLNFPTAKAGTFTVFGMGGISSNTFKPDKDTTAWEFQKDGYNILYKNRMGAAGATHTIPLGRRASLNTAVVASGVKTTRDAYPVNKVDFTPLEPREYDLLSKRKISLSSILTYRANEKSRFKIGVYLTSGQDHIEPNYAFWKFNSTIFQPFADWTYHLSPSVTTEIGLHSMISKLKISGATTHSTLEPRAAVKWQIGGRSQLSFSYGLHSQMQLPQIYAADYSTVEFSGNQHLRPTKANHFVLGYQQSLAGSSSLKLEAYWQEQFDVPIGRSPYDLFSAINLVETRINSSLVNAGTGRNYGLEVTYQKLLTDQFYLLVSGSLYKATYVPADGVRRESRFDGRHTFSLTTGKEFKSGQQSLWGVNAKILWLGGFRDQPIDLENSEKFNTTIYSSSDFSVKMKDYFRPDLRIYWKRSKTKYSRTLALDLQNVSGTKNEAYRYYDTFQKKIVRQNQLGLIPVLSYRWEF